MKPSRLVLGATVGIALAIGGVAGCGGGDDSAQAGQAPSPGPQASAAKHVTRVTLRESDYGKVLFDNTGQALYLFTADTAKRSNCSGDCAEAWPPFYARGRLTAGSGVRKSLLGSIRRADGTRQVTYAGHPLYFYVHDPKGEILCHDVTEFGGDWLVVRTSGKPAP